MNEAQNSRLSFSAGIALMSGAALMVFFMLHHPSTSSGELGAALAEIREEGALSAWVHGLLIAVMAGICYGTYGLTHQLGIGRALPSLGFMLFGMGTLSYFLAAMVSGFIVPQIAAAYADSTPELMVQARAQLRLSGIANQIFANAGLIGTSAGIACWSVALTARASLAAWLGWFGLVVSIVPALLLISGHLHLHVTGMTLVMVADSAWYLLAGVVLLRTPLVSPETRLV